MKLKLWTMGAALALSSWTSQAAERSILDFRNNGLQAVLDVVYPNTSALNWKVGDFQKIDLDFAGIAKGTQSKVVTKDEPEQNALWLTSVQDILNQKQTVEALISRVDGKTIKRIVNGKEEAPSTGTGPESKVEIIEQSETEVTVPAGKFECVYIKAKITTEGQEPQQLEAWINPVAVNLGGVIKMVLGSKMGPISLVLKEFGPKP